MNVPFNDDEKQLQMFVSNMLKTVSIEVKIA